MNRSGKFPKRRAPKRGCSGCVALLAILVALACFPKPVRAQVNSNNTSVNLVAILGTSIGISAAPGTVNFNLVPGGVSNGSSAITVRTDWNLTPSMGWVTLYSYFSSAPAALTNGAGSNIPSANVLGSPNAGALTPFTGNSPFAAGSSVTIYTQKVTGNSRQVTRNDTLALQINLAGLTLPAGTYTGILHFRAQVI
jgi:hypothetical protein